MAEPLQPPPGPGSTEILELRAFLARAAGLSRGALVEAIRHDQSKRWKRGERAFVEDYLRKPGGVELPDDAVLDLIYSEVMLRESSRESPTLEDYLQRFPALASPLRRQFAIHEALEEGSLDLSADEEEHKVAWTPTRVQRNQPSANKQTQLAVSGADFDSTAHDRPATHSEELQQCSIPGYEILGILGRGGKGVVYKARQRTLNRLVALKMILSGEHAAEEELVRFQSEAEVVASIKHLNIVPVFEISQHAGRPYFTMEYVEGGSLSKKLAGEPQSPEAAAQLVETLARAIHTAHEKGFIHRDLKPANVLLTSEGIPKITDFGLAKRMEGGAGLTQSGDVLGTPSYMAPEQAGGRIREITPATDVYALGAILYESLTGRPPFRAATAVDTMMQVLSEDPVPPTRLQSKVPKDLETICTKALEKQPHKRYGSALALAEDLHRFLQQEPILARPVGPISRTIKWARRRPTLAAAGGISIAMAMVAFFSLLFAWRQSVSSNKSLAAALARAEENLYINQIALAQREWLANNVARAAEILEECPARQRNWEWRYLYRQFHPELRILKGHSGPVVELAVSPDGTHLASGSADGTVGIWDLEKGSLEKTLDSLKDPIASVCYSANGELLAAVNRRETLKVWSAKQKKELFSHQGSSGGPGGGCVRFSPDGKRLAHVLGNQAVQIWDCATWQELLVLPGDDTWHSSVSCSFSTDGKRIATGKYVWDLSTRSKLFTLDVEQPAVTFSPDGKYLAWLRSDQTIRLSDARTGTEILGLPGIVSDANPSLAFSPDGRQLLAIGQTGQSIGAWDIALGSIVLTLRGTSSALTCAMFSADGQRILAGAGDCSIHVWDATTPIEALALATPADVDRVASLEFIESGRALATTHETTKAILLDRNGLDHVEVQPNAIEIWDARTGLVRQRLRGHADNAWTFAEHPGGRTAASGGEDREIRIWDLQTGETLGVLKGHQAGIRVICYSPDGTRLVSAAGNYRGLRGRPASHEMKIWDADTGGELASLDGHEAEVWDIAFDSRGSRFATAGGDGIVKLWDPKTGQHLTDLIGHSGRVLRLSFHPDGQQLASAGEDRAIRIWDVATGQLVRQISGHKGPITGLVYSRDGERLYSAAGVNDGTLKIWNAATGQEILSLIAHAQGVRALSLNASGALLATAGHDGRISIWNGEELQAAQRAERIQYSASRSSYLHLLEAESCEASRNWFGAAFHLRQADRAGIRDVSIHVRLGDCLAEMANWPEAIKQFELARTGRPADPANWRKLTMAFLAVGDWTKQDKFLQDLAGRTELRADPQAQLQLAALGLFDRQLRLKGLSAVPAAARIQQVDADYLTMLAAQSYREGRFVEAVKHLESALKEPGSGSTAKTQFLLALSYAGMGKPDQAKESLAKAIESQKASAQASDGAGADWDQRLELKLLREEAEQAVVGKPPELK